MSDGHDVSVVAYSANPWDDRLTLKIECMTCASEWGWSTDKNGAYDRLAALVELHKREARKEGTR